MKANSSQHPADRLALALDRSQSVLTTIRELYDIETERFVGGESFAVHAISAISNMIADAKEALTDLHYSCDLAILDEHSDESGTSSHEIVKDYSQDNDLGSMPPDFRESVARVDQPTNAIEAEMKAQDEDFAQSYLELLRKLTAAEVFASEQQSLSAPGTESELLPLLKSLREDLQKIHNAA